MDGLLVIDKPAGPTSHEVVARVRRVLGERRVGHTGTLDPAATGVLPLVVGRATRLARFLSASEKSYEAIVRLGVATDTGDAQGMPVGRYGQHPQGPWPSRDAIEHMLDTFRGTHLQQPPAFSAKKIDGIRSYKLARARTAAALAPCAPPAPDPVLVTAHTIDVVSVEDDRVTIRLECSAGFYVRTLAHALGERLGVGAHLAALRRTRSGDLTLDEAVGLDAIDREPDLAVRSLVPLSRMLLSLQAVTLSLEGVRRAAHGQDLRPEDATGDFTASIDAPDPKGPGRHASLRLLDVEGQLVGIAELSPTPGVLHPAVVLV